MHDTITCGTTHCVSHGYGGCRASTMRCKYRTPADTTRPYHCIACGATFSCAVDLSAHHAAYEHCRSIADKARDSAARGRNVCPRCRGEIIAPRLAYITADGQLVCYTCMTDVERKSEHQPPTLWTCGKEGCGRISFATELTDGCGTSPGDRCPVCACAVSECNEDGVEL